MGRDLASGKHRLLYPGLAFGLRLLGASAGRLSPRLRGMSAYLAGLIDQRRYAEVDVLIAQVMRRWLAPLRRMRVTSPRRREIPIDAATERFAPDGFVVSKASWIFPSPEAPLLVSVVIPCFNYGRYIEEAIASVRGQTIASCEIIVVDDGSTEAETRDVIERLARDPSLRLVRQVNQGLPSARNNGIAIARSEYVCCLDADDLIEPTYLETAIAVLCADRAAGFAYSHVRMFGDSSEVWATRDFDIQQALVANFTAVNAVFRRDDWHEVGGYSPAMLGGFEDWEFWIRLSALGRRGRVIHYPLFLHRRHGRTMTHDAKDRQDELQARIREQNPAVFADASLRRRIAEVVSKPVDAGSAFGRMAAAITADDRPGLLIVIPWLRRGGAEVLMRSILAGFTSGRRITVVTTEDDPQAMMPEFQQFCGDIFHLHGMLERRHHLSFLRHLAVSRGATHVLSSGSAWFLSNLEEFRAGAAAGIRVVNILHNEVPDSVFRAAVAAGFRLDRHVAVSRRVVDALTAAGIADERIVHIENGIDPQPYAKASLRRAFVRQRLGLTETDRLLLWVGRFAAEKRPDVFVDAMAVLRDRGPFHAVMVGEGPKEASVDAAIARNGLGDRITRLGHLSREDVAELLAAADMLVLTSAVEGMPLIVLESLAAGCPVAATDVGDIAHVIHVGRQGILVPPGRPMDLVEAIPAFLAVEDAEERRRCIRDGFRDGPHTLAAMQAAYRQMLDVL